MIGRVEWINMKESVIAPWNLNSLKKKESFCSLIYSYCLLDCLTHLRPSINIGRKIKVSKRKSHSLLWDFAFPSPRALLSRHSNQDLIPHFLFLCSDVTFSATPSITILFKIEVIPGTHLSLVPHPCLSPLSFSTSSYLIHFTYLRFIHPFILWLPTGM